jgi:AcrR family transcriptional regulator
MVPRQIGQSAESTVGMNDVERDDEGTALRNEPKQTRSKETFSAIVEAAAELFGAQGYEGTTTHQVADRAGVSVGGLYRYFANKEALVVALYHEFVSDMRASLLRTFPFTDLIGADIRSLVRKTIAAAFQLYGERAGLRRVLAEQSRKIPELIELRREQETEMRRTVARLLSAYPSQQLPDPEVGAYLIRLLIESLIDDYLFNLEHGAAFEKDRLIDAATDFIVRYVIGRVE